MPGDKFYGQVNLVPRDTLETALADLTRVLALLENSVPDLLPDTKPPGKVACKGISNFKDRG